MILSFFIIFFCNFFCDCVLQFFDYDTNKISVPLSLIGASVNARLKAKTGRALQARELEFLASIIGTIHNLLY